MDVYFTSGGDEGAGEDCVHGRGHEEGRVGNTTGCDLGAGDEFYVFFVNGGLLVEEVRKYWMSK